LTFQEEEKTRISIPAPLQQSKEGSAVLVQIYGDALGRRYVLTDDKMTIGRDDSNDIVLQDENVSRFHAEVRVDGASVSLVDKGSTNGSRVNDQEITTQTLESGDLLHIGSFILKYLRSEDPESLYHEEIYRMTIIDGLTEVANRRRLEEFLDRELAGAQRHGRALSVAVIDADHFKNVNDKYGHIAGDFVLRKLANVIQGIIRRDELLARYGGEEFVVVMPSTSLDQGAMLGEKIRALVESTAFEFEDRRIPVTVSVGVATLREAIQTVDSFIHTADEALYRAKEEGRNRVCIAP